jgi:[ribosomal protein S5]-alanine N-acetyltransferase
VASYFLQSTHLGFRQWSTKDIELAMGLWGDAEVTKCIGGPFSEAQVSQRLLKEIASQREHGIQYWPIFLLTTGEHVGCCGLRPYKQKIYEIGFHLRKRFWGQGYAAEAAQVVINYAFHTLEAQALFAGHHPDNEASRRLLTKLGFQYTHDQYYTPTGLNHPSYLLTNSTNA